ncbi:MAG: hypothetical protein ACRC1D_10420 [Culicoidibacterales bacterium]
MQQSEIIVIAMSVISILGTFTAVFFKAMKPMIDLNENFVRLNMMIEQNGLDHAMLIERAEYVKNVAHGNRDAIQIHEVRLSVLENTVNN